MWSPKPPTSSLSSSTFANPLTPSNPTHPFSPGTSSAVPSHARTSSNASPPSRRQGKRIAQIVRLKKEFVEEYKKCHREVWPEVLKQIKECNIEDYSIFHDPDTGVLFASFKYVGVDWDGDMMKMREDPKVQEWWKMTDSYQESLVEGAKSSYDGEPAWWKGIEEVFYNP